MLINGIEYTKEKIAGMTDFAVLDPQTDSKKIVEVCNLAKKYVFKGVHPNPVWAERVAQELEGTGIETGLALAFPFGALPTQLKVNEAVEMCRLMNKRPACIDMVTAVGHLKDKDYKYYTNDIAEVVKVAHDNGYVFKSILEVALLSDEEIETATKCACEAGVDYVKTSSGRNGNPSVKAVKIMRKTAPKEVGVKFAGYGGFNPAQLTVMAIASGASVLGTRMAPQIIDELFAWDADMVIGK